jgi:hypothetical protein
MLNSIKYVLGLLQEAVSAALRDPLVYAADSAAWMIKFGAGLWLVLFAANFVLKMLGL